MITIFSSIKIIDIHWTLDIMLYLGATLQPTLYPNERSNEMHYEVPFVCCRCHSSEEVITSHHIIPCMNAMRATNDLELLSYLKTKQKNAHFIHSFVNTKQFCNLD